MRKTDEAQSCEQVWTWEPVCVRARLGRGVPRGAQSVATSWRG